jgi:hypothetical protein
MEKINIVVCGDSYMCRDSGHPGTHFSELLSNQYHVTNLARAGVSNIEIGFQLKRAIELAPDYVMMSTTDSNRIEIPIANTRKINTIKLEHFRPGNERYYISSNIQTLMSSDSYGFSEFATHVPPETMEAIKQYLTYIHDEKYRTEIDKWIIDYWLMQLAKNKIGYYVFDKDFAVYRAPFVMDPIYHTDYAVQKIAVAWVNNHLACVFNS